MVLRVLEAERLQHKESKFIGLAHNIPLRILSTDLQTQANYR